MSITIKNEETCLLAAELASLTGESKTIAIKIALQQRLERELRTRSATCRIKEMRQIADRCASLLESGPSAVEHGDMLYDDRGLPR